MKTYTLEVSEQELARIFFVMGSVNGAVFGIPLTVKQ